MALKGLDIFKLTPKTNCKDCGSPTCMAFSMKVAQGSVTLDMCPHLSEEALAKLSDATAPPMAKITLGLSSDFILGGETVLFRHEKTFVSKNLYAVSIDLDRYDKKIKKIKAVDYDRLGESMYIEFLFLHYDGDKDGFFKLVKKGNVSARTLILNCADVDTARVALEICATGKPLLNGANALNYEVMNVLATEFDVVLGVTGTDIEELHDTVSKLEKLGNKNLVLDVGCLSIKEAFANTVQIRRAALKDKNRTFGYPSLVNVGALAPGNKHLQTALASVFTLKYGSIIVMEDMSYAQALPLFGLRQNIYTDPQKPMKVEPGIYSLNNADENAVCALTVDFALTYFIVSGEYERAGVPVNLLIPDAGGYSVLTAWAAGKLSASTIAKFISDFDIEKKILNRTLIIPGLVAILKGELEDKLPGWKIVVGPNEALGIVKFMKEKQYE